MTGWLSHVPGPLRRTFLTLCELRSFEGGETIYHLSDVPEGLWGVASGAVGIFADATGGGSKPLHIFRPGDWMGEASILGDGGGYFVSTVALEPSTMLFAPRRKVLALLESRPEFWPWVGYLSLMHTVSAIQFLTDLLHRNSEARLIAVLLRLAGPDSTSYANESGEPKPIGVTQERIGEMANLSRGSTVTLLGALEVDGLVKCGYGKIDIIDPGALLERISGR